MNGKYREEVQAIAIGLTTSSFLNLTLYHCTCIWSILFSNPCVCVSTHLNYANPYFNWTNLSLHPTWFEFMNFIKFVNDEVFCGVKKLRNLWTINKFISKLFKQTSYVLRLFTFRSIQIYCLIISSLTSVNIWCLLTWYESWSVMNSFRLFFSQSYFKFHDLQ